MNKNIIYENEDFYVEIEESEIPWLKVFPKESYKELSDMSKILKIELFEIYDIIEKEMIEYYQPEKINMASFGNMLPQVHLHVMCRYKEDSYFPNPMWGEKLRDSNLVIPSNEIFYKHLNGILIEKLK